MRGWQRRAPHPDPGGAGGPRARSRGSRTREKLLITVQRPRTVQQGVPAHCARSRPFQFGLPARSPGDQRVRPTVSAPDPELSDGEVTAGVPATRCTSFPTGARVCAVCQCVRLCACEAACVRVRVWESVGGRGAAGQAPHPRPPASGAPAEPLGSHQGGLRDEGPRPPWRWWFLG